MKSWIVAVAVVALYGLALGVVMEGARLDLRERQDRELIALLIQNQKAEADILMRSAGK